MGSNFKIGNYQIASEKYYNALTKNNITSDKMLSKLDTNKDNILSEDELVSIEVEENENTENKAPQTTEEKIKESKDKYEEQLLALYKQIDTLEEQKRKCGQKMSGTKDMDSLDEIISNMDNLSSQISSLKQQVVTTMCNMESEITNIQQSASTLDANGTYNVNTGSGVTGQTNFSYNFTENLTGYQQEDLGRFKSHWEQNKTRYQNVSAQTGVPAELIAAIHWRESTGNFNARLHDGRSLGNFSSWEASAIDALGGGYGAIDKNDITTWYNFAENYNGTGYRKKGVASPYVWAGTTNYSSGKYVADHVYDAGCVDKQLGVAVMLKAILQ